MATSANPLNTAGNTGTPEPKTSGRPKGNTVTVTVGSGENEKTFTRTYVREDLDSLDELLKFIQDPKNAAYVLNTYNYGHDLKVRASIRNEILEQSAGPDKAIEKAANALITVMKTMGKVMTMEQAVAKVKALGLAEEAAE